MNYKLANYDRLIIDFDGVLTDNKVYVDEVGREAVLCSRADGLAFDVLRIIGFDALILSTEKNPVVTMRAKKLGVPVISSVGDKRSKIASLAKHRAWDLSRTIYLGNDLNDYFAMRLCGLVVCPYDAHQKIIEISDIVLNTKGGDGVIRELLEQVFEVDFLDVLYGVEK